MPKSSMLRHSLSFQLWMGYKPSILICGAMLLCLQLLQAQQFPFVYYTPKDGLINSRVRSIKQDSKGRMYFITYGGLSVYDGARFINYNQQTGLVNDLVNDVIEVAPDSMLIATNTGILNMLVHGKLTECNLAGQHHPVINRFYLSRDSVVYATADQGLFKIEGNEFVKIPLSDDHGREIGQYLDYITAWQQYLFVTPWATAEREKLIVYDTERQAVVATITDKVIVSLAVTPAGELWLSSVDGIETVDLPALRAGQLQLRKPDFLIDAAFYKDKSLYFDAVGNAWMYGPDEIIRLSPGGAVHSFSPAEGLASGKINDLIVDREGMIWMATNGNGIIKLPGMDFSIADELRPGTKNRLQRMYAQGDTLWLFNTTDHSIYRRIRDQLSVFPLDNTNTNVTVMYSLDKALYYVNDQKRYKIENKHEIASYAHPVRILAEEKCMAVGSTIIDSHGCVLQFAREADTVYSLLAILHDKVICRQALSYAVDQLALDDLNQLWLTTRDDHLLVFSLHPEHPAQYLQLAHDYSTHIGNIGPRSITLDNSGNVWIGTRSQGLYRFRFEGNNLVSSDHFNTTHGLTDIFYNTLYCDDDNQVWAGSPTGLDKIAVQGGSYIIENVTKRRNVFQGIRKVINVSGDLIWALTENGDIISIRDAPGKRTALPAFYISSIVANGNNIARDKSDFAHDLNTISIHLAAPSFIDEKAIRYSYELIGSRHTGWSEPSNTSAFNFINLAPGAYVLNMRADFPGVLYPSQFIQYAFTIQPPYWQRWWFRIGMICCVLALLVLAVRYYYQRKLEKQRLILESKRAMEKERTRIATDMHDELGASLTRIKFLSETIGYKKQRHMPVDDEVARIRSNAHHMIDQMGEIVWALNEKNDSLIDLVAYTRAYSAAYLTENGINISITTSDDLPARTINGEFRRNIYLGVKEALHNIVKHAKASHVIMQFIIGDHITISIQDDGIGMERQPARPFSNGLTNMRARMQAIGGSMEIQHDHGTTVIFSAPFA